MSDSLQVALVTGASSGIGKASAEAFIRKNYATILVDQNSEAGKAAEAELGALGECTFVHCDVSSEQSVTNMMIKAVSTYGRIDAAFNAAGINGDFSTAVDCRVDNWDAVMSVNLRGLWLCLKYELQQMLEQGSGAIVNCASTQGLFGTTNLAAYVASKHGVVGLTRAAALENARNNIRINAVCPGMINTPMWQRSITPDMEQQLLAGDPAGRLGMPAEIAEAVVWLCQPGASFVNGHALVVDGGMTIA